MPYEKAEEGTIVIEGNITKVTAVTGKKGAPFRLEVTVADDDQNGHKLEELRGSRVRMQGPYAIADATEHPDQMHLDDAPDEEEGGDEH